MSDVPPIEAPHTAADAARHVQTLREQLGHRRSEAKRWLSIHAYAEKLYREAEAMALLRAEGSSDKVRDAEKILAPVDGSLVDNAASLVEAMGMEDAPETVGDLRWLRDRAKNLAESASAAAYDDRAVLSGWEKVSAMSRQEMELTPGRNRDG